MKRGEIWIGSGSSDFTGKPRPMVIVQSDLLSGSSSVVVCPVTSDDSGAPRFRVALPAGSETGLRTPSWVMADKPTTLLRTKLSKRIGACSADAMGRLDVELMIVVGIA